MFCRKSVFGNRLSHKIGTNREAEHRGDGHICTLGNIETRSDGCGFASHPYILPSLGVRWGADLTPSSMLERFWWVTPPSFTDHRKIHGNFQTFPKIPDGFQGCLTKNFWKSHAQLTYANGFLCISTHCVHIFFFYFYYNYNENFICLHAQCS